MKPVKAFLSAVTSTLFFMNPCHAEVPEEGGGRKREHMLSWKYSSSSTKVTPSGGTSLKVSTGDMKIEYGHNFGWLSLGAGLSTDVSKGTDKHEASASLLHIEGRGHIIENRPGNNLIPYVAIQLEFLSGEAGDGTDTIDISGNAWAISAGLDWFPFGELFALNVNLGLSNADLDYKAPGGIVKADLKGSSLSVGYRIVF